MNRPDTSIDDLDSDTLLHIFTFLEWHNLRGEISLVCRRWRDLANTDALWHAIARDMGVWQLLCNENSDEESDDGNLEVVHVPDHRQTARQLFLDATRRCGACQALFTFRKNQKNHCTIHPGEYDPNGKWFAWPAEKNGAFHVPV